MDFSARYADRVGGIVALFTKTFADSEGPDEGALIGALARDMMEKTPDEDLFVFTAWDQDDLLGAIMFSRLAYPHDNRSVFILAPVAVHPDHQGQGVGQALIVHGLNALREHGVDVAITYGDPHYYCKAGFMPITEEIARAPLTLQYPEGWLAQSLSDQPLSQLKGPSRCVEALNDAAYW